MKLLVTEITILLSHTVLQSRITYLLSIGKET